MPLGMPNQFDGTIFKLSQSYQWQMEWTFRWPFLPDTTAFFYHWIRIKCTRRRQCQMIWIWSNQTSRIRKSSLTLNDDPKTRLVTRQSNLLRQFGLRGECMWLIWIRYNLWWDETTKSLCFQSNAFADVMCQALYMMQVRNYNLSLNDHSASHIISNERNHFIMIIGSCNLEYMKYKCDSEWLDEWTSHLRNSKSYLISTVVVLSCHIQSCEETPEIVLVNRGVDCISALLRLFWSIGELTESLQYNMNQKTQCQLIYEIHFTSHCW